MIVAPGGAVLSKAQAEFNKLMKSLEKAQKNLAQERQRLDKLVMICGTELMPLVHELHQVNFRMVLLGVDLLKTMKFTARRQEGLEDLLGDKARELVEDSCGLSDAEIEQMRGVVSAMSRLSPEQKRQEESEAFDEIRRMMQEMAQQAGVDLDLSDLDLADDPAEIERKLHERLAAAERQHGQRTTSKARARKPTKMQLEKEKRQQEADEAKRRDLKSLYKQLAKVLHPDLETDHDRKQQKEAWMKRLTSAHASGDLRELLCIEMEWLGVEATNLATATDEKLKVYCTVLKEQIAETKAQTQSLMFAPEYAALDRFRHPYSGIVSLPTLIKEDLTEDIERHEDMFAVLRRGGKECQRMLNRWADDEIRARAEERRIFR